MTYDVVWGPLPLNQLARIWTAALDRNAITRAAAVLDRALLLHPLRVGQPLDSSVHRIAYHPPLGIEYEVIEDDKRVIVQAVFSTISN